MKIKGHTEIQLFDRDGNMVQNTHDDNMITNGLAGFLKNHGMMNDTPFSAAVADDVITTLLGGIMLFDSTLTEDVSTTMMPEGVKMIANGAYGITYSGTPTELGSYDANETGWQNATTFRFVYNWNNAQGNGTINSVALTSRAHGYVGEGNSTSNASVSNSGYTCYTYGNSKDLGRASGKVVFMIDSNMLYALAIDTGADELTIYSHGINDTVCDLRNTVDISDYTMDTVATLSNPSANVTLSSYKGVSVREVNSTYVMALRSSDGFIVLTLSSDMSTINSYDEITAATTGLTFNDSDIFFLNADGDYLITYNQTASAMYKIEIANPTNISAITVTGTIITDGKARERYSVGGRHYFGNAVYDETLNKVYVTNDYDDAMIRYVESGDIYKTDNSLVFTESGYSGYVSSSYRNNAYLATVNNLANAVTKDSSQTMKVIYSLTFA